MELTTKVFKRKSGKSKGKWIARIRYFDEGTRKWKNIERSADTRTEAKDLRDKHKREIEKTDGGAVVGEKMTFNRLADVCERLFYGHAVIINGEKQKGVRAYRSKQSELKNLREFFGEKRIRDIRKETVVDYKIARLETISKKTGEALSVATINKELATLRKVLRHAYSEGWIMRDVFLNSKMIDRSFEKERTRIMSLAEEKRLLAACTGKREHLRLILMLATDSGLRRGELLKLEWSDIDFDKEEIVIQACNTKDLKTRVVPLSDRVREGLLKLKEYAMGDRPFPINNIKTGFENAKTAAGISDLRLHDLRRTCLTRLISSGLPLSFAQKIAGHASPEITQKVYVALDSESLTNIREKINSFNLENADSTIETNSGLLN